MDIARFYPLMIITAAFVFDLLIGDPGYPYHPVRLIGRLIIVLEKRFRRIAGGRITAGCLFGLTITGGSAGVVLILITAAGLGDNLTGYPVFSTLVVLYFLYSGISLKDLYNKAMEIYFLLEKNDLKEARFKLSRIVGRETDALTKEGIIRAVVETVAENMVDGVISPLFYGFIGGAPLMTAYKAVNTLDSMVGYKNKKYFYFGRFSARLDDVANFIPARISLFMITIAALLKRKYPLRVLRIAFRDGQKNPSPNSGISEAAIAGALGIQLGGPCIYHGKRIVKPLIGDNIKPLHPDHIKEALGLVICGSVLFFILGLLATGFVYWLVIK
ncbi:MAG: cobalamin biosynthesis protein CobD [Spirochaetales bacterium]|nr:cobalamin biosynthesis protein CobD [Spirochaetales bacterium]